MCGGRFKLKTLTTVLIILTSYNVFATETFKYVDGDSDIPIQNVASRGPASVEANHIKEPVDADPLKDWRPEELDKFDAFLVEKGETREQAYQREVARKNYKKSSKVINRLVDEEDDDLRAPNNVKKSKKKPKFKKKS